MDHRAVALKSGRVLHVPAVNPEWLDEIIADSDTAEEAAARIRARLDEEEA